MDRIKITQTQMTHFFLTRTTNGPGWTGLAHGMELTLSTKFAFQAIFYSLQLQGQKKQNSGSRKYILLSIPFLWTNERTFPFMLFSSFFFYPHNRASLTITDQHRIIGKQQLSWLKIKFHFFISNTVRKTAEKRCSHY